MAEQTAAMTPIAPQLAAVVVQQNTISNVNKIVPRGHEGGARKEQRKPRDKACVSIDACKHTKKCKKCSVCGTITKHKTHHKCRAAKNGKKPSGGGSEQQRIGPPNDVHVQAKGSTYRTPLAAYIWRGVKEHNDKLQSQGKSMLAPTKHSGKQLGELRVKLSQEYTHLDPTKKQHFENKEFPSIFKAAPKKPEFYTKERTRTSETKAKNSIMAGLESLHAMGMRGVGIVMEKSALEPVLVFMPPELLGNGKMHAACLHMMGCLVGASEEVFLKNPRPLHPGQDASICRMLATRTRGELKSALAKKWTAAGGQLTSNGHIPRTAVSTGEVLVSGWPVHLPIKLKTKLYSMQELAVIHKVRWKPLKNPLSCVCCLCHRCRQLMFGFARRH